MDSEFIPALLSETKKNGIAELPIQLPKFMTTPGRRPAPGRWVGTHVQSLPNRAGGGAPTGIFVI
jgi:hypothetical protein